MKIDVYGYTAGVEEEGQVVQIKWQNLGVERAKAIKQILRDNGIANRRIGETKARRQRRLGENT